MALKKIFKLQNTEIAFLFISFLATFYVLARCQPWGLWFALMATVVTFGAIYYNPFVRWSWLISITAGIAILGVPLLFGDTMIAKFFIYGIVALSTGLFTLDIVWSAPFVPKNFNATMCMAFAMLAVIVVSVVFTMPALKWIIWTTGVVAWPISGYAYHELQARLSKYQLIR